MLVTEHLRPHDPPEPDYLPLSSVEARNIRICSLPARRELEELRAALILAGRSAEADQVRQVIITLANMPSVVEAENR